MTTHPASDQLIEPPTKRVRLSSPDASASSKLYPSIEVDVGITQYLNHTLPGFSGVLKQRYTDFLVNEIDLSGKVLRLESLRADGSKPKADKPGEKEWKSKNKDAQIPEHNGGEREVEAVRVMKEEALEDSTTNGNKPTEEVIAKVFIPDEEVKIEEAVAIPPFELSEEDSAILTPALTAPMVNSLVELYNEILAIERTVVPNKKVNTPSTKLTSTTQIDDKDTRATIHKSIRRIFNGKFLTETTGQNHFVIWPARISAPNNPSRNNGTKNFKDQRNNEDRKPTPKFSELGGEYLHFNLYKENKDTMECIQLISRFIKAHHKIFTYAGTKDRRAVTVQRICAQRIRIERIASLNSKLKGFKLGDFEYKSHQLSLGDLLGNEFCISLRDCDFGAEGESVVERAISGVRDYGFINYYGLQRFGTFTTGTHAVGKSMLKGDWKTAIHKIMAYDDLLPPAASKDERDRAVACEIFLRAPTLVSAAKEALNIMPRKFVSENSILRWFSKQEHIDNYLGAIQQIPRNLRLIFVHAYQSYIWNSAVSERMKRWGMTLQPGDLVIIPASELTTEKPILDAAEEDIGMDGDAPTGEETFLRARTLSAEEIASGTFTIYDLVLPTPGWDVIYPENEIRSVYYDMMAKDGLDPSNMRRAQKETSLAGHYRRVVHKPEHVSYEIKSYTGVQEQLVETDLEWATQQARKHKTDIKTEQTTDTVAETGQRKAVILKMRLGTSQYATMALREVLKGGTESYVAVFDDTGKIDDTKDTDMKD